MDEKRHCKKFGQHCAKAHGDHDLRIPKRVISSTNEDVDTNNVDIPNSLFKLINNSKDNEENNGVNNDISNKSDEVNDKNEQPNANDLYIDSFPNKKRDNTSKFERTFKQNENKIKSDTNILKIARRFISK